MTQGTRKHTRRHSMLMLALTAAAGAGLILAGRAMAQQQVRALPASSRASVLMFNPFDPVRTTTASSSAIPGRKPRPGSSVLWSSLTGSSVLGSSFMGPVISPTMSDPTSGGGSTTPLRRPPIRDPFRPPTRSPVAPILGQD